MQQETLQCNINQTVFSWTLFMTRFLVAIVLGYVAAGCLLYYREFLYNAVVLGWHLPVEAAVALALVQVLLALMLMLGWFTRWAAVLSVFCVGAVGVLFFGGDFNRIYVALVGLAITALLPSVLLGPGKISLDYKHAVRRAAKMFRD